LQEQVVMQTVTVPLRVLGFVIGTRAALAAGLGLLLADRLSARQRRAVGVALVGFGAVTTIPAVRWLTRGIRRVPAIGPGDSDSRLIGATRYPRKGDDW
jgi:hypothetical protein